MDHYFTNNDNLKSEIKNITYTYNGKDYNFFSDNGVFSKDKIDYGSRTLLETFLNEKDIHGSILDVGCGYGFLGLMVANILDLPVTLIDVNKRALHLAKMNADNFKIKADIFESNGYENVKLKYDYIITNPPVRAGKEVLINILINAKDYLNPGGKLYYVLRKDQGAKSIEKIVSEHYKVTNIEKSKGFYIYCAQKC